MMFVRIDRHLRSSILDITPITVYSPIAGMTFLRKLHTLLSPVVISRADNIAIQGQDELQDVIAHISAPIEVFDPERCQGDHYMFKMFARGHGGLSMPAFAKMLCLYEAEYPDFAYLLKFYLVVPLNSASAERGFSAQNYIKTKSRNRLSEDRLSQIIRVSVNGPDWSKFDHYENVAANFRAVKERLI